MHARRCFHGLVAAAPETTRIPPTSLVLCVSAECIDRFGPVLRHLMVGLVDHAARIRVVSTDPRVERFALGPVQTIVHPPLRWPLVHRRRARVLEALVPSPPTVIHAMSRASYQTALALAEEFESDLVLQITSPEDCAEAERFDSSHVGRYIPFSEPLARLLADQLRLPPQQVEVIRPGVASVDRPVCFARPDRAPAVVCTAPLEKDAGVDRVIEAAHLINRQGRRALFFLLGRGSQESVLRRKARDKDVLSTVTFAQPGGGPFSVLSSADVFVHPAERGAMYVEALQAMGAGLSVVAVPDASADFLHPGQTAIVCDAGTAKDLADGINDLLHDRAMAQRLSRNSLDYVRANHAMSAMADQTAAVYRRLLLARSTLSLRE